MFLFFIYFIYHIDAVVEHLDTTINGRKYIIIKDAAS